MKKYSLVLVGVFVILGLNQEAFSQSIKKSQYAEVMQRVKRTDITLTYSRPLAKGRDIYGSLVPYGKEWTPGANNSTTFEVNSDVLVEGQELPEGKYSIWTIPGENQWTIIFSKRHDAFHTRYPVGEDALRVNVKPQSAEHMEALMCYFKEVKPEEALLLIHWDTVAVPINIKVK